MLGVHPCSDTGRLESELQSVSRKVDGKAESNEVYSLRSDVDRLEHTVRDLSASVDALRYELENMRETFRNI